ncbi:hypothetical protein EIP86_009652 [Pleurotus ostreatoroseus]|nr:hypothetical protein EIP86_009652 [Pleurotus ostreatoroseus]
MAAEFTSAYHACRFCHYVKPTQDMAQHLEVCAARRRDDVGYTKPLDLLKLMNPRLYRELRARERQKKREREQREQERDQRRVREFQETMEVARARARARAVSTPDLQRAEEGQAEEQGNAEGPEENYYGDSETLVDADGVSAEGPLAAEWTTPARIIALDLAERFPIVEPPSPVLQPLAMTLSKGCGEMIPPPYLDLSGPSRSAWSA